MVIQVDGPLVSRPYVDMTLAMMRQLADYEIDTSTPGIFHVRPCIQYGMKPFTIEPDASAASYFFAAAALTGGRVTVLDLPENSIQGDVHFVDLLADMGCRVEKCSSGITVHGRPLHGIDVDMNAISDTVMTLAAVACFAEGPTTIRNVAHIRHKETDRLAALTAELRKVGAEVEEFADGLRITPRPLHGAEIETYNDHRMAMSMALIGLKVPGIVIKDPGCVAKTYPGFFTDLERLRLKELATDAQRTPRGSSKCRRTQASPASHLFFAFLFCFSVPSVAQSSAALDPQLKQPYSLTIVLRVAPHRLLTPVFKGQLQRELGDSLQASLGKLAKVQVVTTHPLLKDIDSRGLQAVLDGLEKGPATAGKLHFVLLDFAEGQYTIQAGQYDGLTGLATPIVRQAHTDDRQFVAKQAALLVERDFGIVGTVVKKIEGAKIEVALKGGGLGDSVDRSIKKDQIFALAQILQAGTGKRAVRVREAFLQVVEEPKQGVCICRLINRYRDDASKLMEKPGVLGYRCLKLGSDEGPLRLRLVDDKGLPLDGLQVEVGRHGFDRKDGFKPRGSTKGGNLPFSPEKYEHLAFVKVLYRRTLIAQVPVVILNGRTAVCRVSIADPNETVGQVLARKKRVVERLLESLQVQDDLRKAVGQVETGAGTARCSGRPQEPEDGPGGVGSGVGRSRCGDGKTAREVSA